MFKQPQMLVHDKMFIFGVLDWILAKWPNRLNSFLLDQ